MKGMFPLEVFKPQAEAPTKYGPLKALPLHKRVSHPPKTNSNLPNPWIGSDVGVVRIRTLELFKQAKSSP